jgi:hypothetical protein
MHNNPPALTTQQISGVQGSFSLLTSLQWPYEASAATITPVTGFTFALQPVDNSQCQDNQNVRLCAGTVADDVW